MKVAALGNFGPSFSTESHLALSWESLGHEVTRIQEGDVRALDIPGLTHGHDLFTWTQTYSLAEAGGTRAERLVMLEAIRAMGIPSVGIHLDLWFSIGREEQVRTEPFFQVDHLFSADGGHQAEFAKAGVNHHWSPPGVYGAECYLADPRDEYRSPVAFVGNWRGSYHHESTHRREMIRFLRRYFRKQIVFWPSGPAIRGDDLNALYASTQVVVGDSCMVPHLSHYISDRVPETLGRGGFLLHPHVEGVFPDLWESGEHLVTWNAGDWDDLGDKIRYYLEHDDERERIRVAGHEHTKAHHTYAHRLQAIIDHVFAEVAA